MNILRFALTVLVLYTCQSAAAPCALAQKRYALIIGVNKCPNFRFPDGTTPRPLRGAERDADAVRNILIDVYQFSKGNVVLLKGAEAKRKRIQQEFYRLSKRIAKKDTFVFYFSGHGTQINDVKPFDEKDGLDEALCPSDATGKGKHLIRDDELGLWIDRISAGNVTVILDCCHSGSGIKDPGDPTLVARFLRVAKARQQSQPEIKSWSELDAITKSFGRQLTAFYACQPNQSAYERRFLNAKPPVRAGQFTYSFLKGLRKNRADADKDNTISSQEAFDFARAQLKQFNATRPQVDRKQLPLLKSEDPDAPLFGLGQSGTGR